MKLTSSLLEQGQLPTWAESDTHCTLCGSTIHEPEQNQETCADCERDISPNFLVMEQGGVWLNPPNHLNRGK